MRAPVSLDGFGSTLLAVAWAECGAGTLLLAMRIYTNGFLLRRWNADFWWALSTYVFGLLANVFLTVSVEFGLGDHLKDLLALDPELVSKNQFYQWIFTTFAIAGIALGKMAIIVFILQVEDRAKTSRKWILYALAASNMIVNIIIIPIIWVQCTPTTKIWDESVPGDCAGRERNQIYGYFQGSFGAAVDLALALYPVLIFWQLQLRLHVKIGLTVLFGFGVVATVCSAIKTTKLSTLTATSDLTFILGTLDIWASTELWVVFIVSCIPPIRPLFVKVFQKASSSLGRSGYMQNGTSKDLGTNANAYASHNHSKSKSRNSSMPVKNDSEEEILQEEGGIMMTKQISVRYQETSSKNWSELRDGSDETWKTRYEAN